MEPYPNRLFRTDLLPDPLDIRYEDHYRNASRQNNANFRHIPYTKSKTILVRADDSILPGIEEDCTNKASQVIEDDQYVFPTNATNTGVIEEVLFGQNYGNFAEEEITEDSAQREIPNLLNETFPAVDDFYHSEPGINEYIDSDKIQSHSSQNIVEPHDNHITSHDQAPVYLAQSNEPEFKKNIKSDECEIQPQVNQYLVEPNGTPTNSEDQLPNNAAEYISEGDAKDQSFEISDANQKSGTAGHTAEKSESRNDGLSKLDMLEKDPILQKYMDMIMEKRRDSSAIIDQDARVISFTAKLEACYINTKK